MTKMGVGTAVLAATLFAGGVMAADVAPVCNDWDQVATPNSERSSDLRSVDAFDVANIWAVGHQWDAAGVPDGTPLAMRWGQGAWIAEPLPDLTYLGTQPTLESVAIAPTGDPWVVGHLRDETSGRSVPLILRWSGGFWETHRVTMLDGFAPRFPLLRDVAAIAASDAWVVGEAETLVKRVIEPYAAHWDGIAWSEVAFPGSAQDNRFVTAVSAAGSKAVWAVGYDVTPAKGTTFARIYRWDGTVWSVVDQPAAGKAGSVLHDLVAIAPDDIWAVGQIGTDVGLFLHWDGSSWTSYPAPPRADPRSVDAATSNDVWAADANGNYHWDGTSWSFLPAMTKPYPGTRRALAVVGPCEVWAISSWSGTGGSTSLVEWLRPYAAPAPPATPTAFVVKPMSSTQIAVAWLPAVTPDTFDENTMFVIERCEGDVGSCSTDFTAIQKAGARATSFVDSSLSPATSYTYRMYAANGGGNSELTTPAEARTSPTASPSSLPAKRPGPPAAPIAFVAKPVTSRQIALGWLSGGDPTDRVGQMAFVIERCDGGCPKGFTVIRKVPGTVTSFIDSGLAPVTSYTYRIYAVNNAGTSAPTVPETAITFPADIPSPLPEPTTGLSIPRPPQRPSPPAAPVAFVVKPATSSQIALGWFSGGDPTGTVGQTAFVIERCDGACPKGFTVIRKVPGTETSFIDSDLAPVSSYTYRIYAVNDAGSSAPTAPETAITFPADTSSPLPVPSQRTVRGPRS